MQTFARLALILVCACPSAAFHAGSVVTRLPSSQRGSMQRFGVCGASGNDAPRGLATVPWLPPLKNRYFAMRHGQSTANVEGVISSLPAVGTTTHGLTPLGVEQARSAAPQVIKQEVGMGDLCGTLRLVTNFSRDNGPPTSPLRGRWFFYLHQQIAKV
jgi:hypothetical protein